MEDKTFTLPDVRNKLSPITNLLAILETLEINYTDDDIKELFLQELSQCKKSIDYLSK